MNDDQLRDAAEKALNDPSNDVQFLARAIIGEFYTDEPSKETLTDLAWKIIEAGSPAIVARARELHEKASMPISQALDLAFAETPSERQEAEAVGQGERAAFEAWFLHDNWGDEADPPRWVLKRDGDGYAESDTETSWRAWQARASLPASPSQGQVPLEWRKAVMEAYGHLWHVNNEPLAPIPLRSPEKAAYEARKCLRDLLTKEQRGEAINAVGELIGRFAAQSQPEHVAASPSQGVPQAMNNTQLLFGAETLTECIDDCYLQRGDWRTNARYFARAICSLRDAMWQHHLSAAPSQPAQGDA